MSQKQSELTKIKEYEILQDEYKHLLLEYENIKADNPHSQQLKNKIKELIQKQKEIQKTLLELK
ncbi:hypothetical protein Nisw_06700 [Candidatus Nitrosopumilus sp. SW]|uniref:hypothetical protein n=1 Tax=Candidatus Nitrosopumilus sp. SW TaxID=2508726 RepID=UPI001152DDD4|nr:hypothetical protein [Candidatus Nitrosopumilus sp. SW]QDI89234.1 hypothetical protein Nisw_06700 [Candidatus Nitrosopumilus sp. SW]